MKKTFSGNKKGMYGLEGLPALGIVFGVTAIVFGLVTVILAAFMNNTNVSSNAAAVQVLNNSIHAVGEIPNNWLTLIAIVIAAAFLVTITVAGLMHAFGYGFGGGGRS